MTLFHNSSAPHPHPTLARSHDVHVVLQKHTPPRYFHSLHPATPWLAGIICSGSIVVAWTVCFIYWLWNRRKEKQDFAESEAIRNSKAMGKGAVRPPSQNVTARPTSKRAAAERSQRISTAEKEKQTAKEHRKSRDEERRAVELAKLDRPLIPNGRWQG